MGFDPIVSAHSCEASHTHICAPNSYTLQNGPLSFPIVPEQISFTMPCSSPGLRFSLSFVRSSTSQTICLVLSHRCPNLLVDIATCTVPFLVYSIRKKISKRTWLSLEVRTRKSSHTTPRHPQRKNHRRREQHRVRRPWRREALNSYVHRNPRPRSNCGRKPLEWRKTRLQWLGRRLNGIDRLEWRNQWKGKTSGSRKKKKRARLVWR